MNEQCSDLIKREIEPHWHSALCVGLATSLTMLFVGAFHIPYPYLSLVFATSLSMMPRPTLRQVFSQIVALSSGTIGAILLLVAFPEEPWFFIPLLGGIAGIGYSFFLKRSGPGSAASFSYYFLAIHVTCIIEHFSPQMMTTALEFWLQAFIAIVASYAAALLTKKENRRSITKILPLSHIVMIAVTASIAGLIDASIEANQGGRLLLSSISTITALEITHSSYQLLSKLGGYLFGIIVAFSFIIITTSSGNDFGFFLLAIAFSFGCLEWFSCYCSKAGMFYQSVAMMLSFCVVMLPAPDANLHVAYERSLATLVGFIIAVLVFLVGRELTKILHSSDAPS